MQKETSPHYDRVKQLMQKAGQECPEKPTIPSKEIRRLRAKLILEEAIAETIVALGFRIMSTPSGFEIIEVCEPSLVDIIDGCIDTRVVTTGTLISCGIKDIIPCQLVDMNNLNKFGPGSYRREDGKWIKPPGHKPPDWKAEIERQSSL